MNTRTYPRSTMQAFPKTCEHACAIERPASRLADRCVTFTLWMAVVVIVLSIAFVGPAA